MGLEKKFLFPKLNYNILNFEETRYIGFSPLILYFLYLQLVGVDYVLFQQKNDLNLKNRTLDIEVKNESFSSRITLTEKCRYYVSNRFKFNMEAGFVFSSWFAFFACQKKNSIVILKC